MKALMMLVYLLVSSPITISTDKDVPSVYLGVGVDIVQERQSPFKYLVKGHGCGGARISVIGPDEVEIASSGQLNGASFGWRFSADNWPPGSYDIIVVSGTQACQAKKTITIY